MAVTYNIKGTPQSSFKVGKQGAGTVEIGGIDATGNSSVATVTGSLVPSANITYDLGSSSLMWRDLYVGPGSIYVNGKKVIEDNAGTINITTDENQNLTIATSGTGETTMSSAAGLNFSTSSTGDITFTTASGQIEFDGDIIVNAAKSISSSNAEAIAFADPISVTGNSEMANLTVTGNLTVQGTTTTIDSTTVQIQNAFVFEGATDDGFETTLTVTDPTADRTITLPDATGTAALLESTQTFTGAITFDASGNSVIVSDTLRIAQSGSGLRMTNVGAFDNDGSDNFRIYGTNNLYLRANGENGGGLSIDSTNQDVTIDNDLRVSAGQFYYGGTAVTSTAIELNLLDGVTGTLVTEAGSQTLTNKTLGATTISGHLTPSANVTYDLGTSSNRFRDIYLSGTTIDLGGAKLSNDGSNNLDIKDGNGNRKTLRASSIELVDSTGKIMRLERDATSGKLKQSRKNSDGSDEGSSDTIDIAGDTSPQLGGTLDANGNDIDMGTNTITDAKVGNWDTAYSWGDHSTQGYLTSFTETNDLTSAVTWANVPDANITSSSVVQHQANLTITESQISDLSAYLENVSEDTTPQLGGDLDLNSSDITGTGNINISGNATISNDLTVNGSQSITRAYTFVSSTGSIALSSTQSKIGSTSLFVESGEVGTWQQAFLPQFDSGDAWCLEFWFYVPSITTTTRLVTNLGDGSPRPFFISLLGGTNRIEVNMQQDAGQIRYNRTPDNSVSSATWHHIAVSNDGSVSRVYLDGVLQFNLSISGVIAPDIVSYLEIGGGAGSPDDFYIDGFRISDVDVYPSGTTFTPPTSLTVNSNTVVLSTFEGSDGDTSFTTESKDDVEVTTGMFVDGSAGNIGINTLLPNSELDVRGTVTATTFSGTNLTIDTDTLHVDSTNNRVGIGTTSPSVELDVTGDGAFSGNVTVTGNLTVNGTTTTVNSTEVNVQNAFVFEGATDDGFETTLTVTDPTADRTITLPDATGTVAFTSDLYTNSDVDAHLNQSNPTDGYVLSWTSGDYAWVEQSGGSTYTAQSSAPSSPSAGDEWYDTDTGDFYKYINDGTTSQWVEWSPAGGALGFTGGSYNASTGVVTFTSDDGLGFSTGDLRGADGSGASLDGTTAITGDILPDTTNTRDLGSSTKKYAEIHATTFYGTATSAQYADLAEMYAGDQAYEPGTVVVVGGTHEVTQCTKHLDSSLAGVVSEKPGYLMNKDIDAEHPVCVGFVGRVPVKVVGHIEKGDLLTTSSIPGFATKYTKGSYEPGCIIGVALNTKNEIGEGTVEVLLKRS